MKAQFKQIMGTVGLIGTHFVMGFLGIKAETAITTGVACASHVAVCKTVAVVAGGFSVTVSPIVLIAAGAAGIIILHYMRGHGPGQHSETAGDFAAAAFEGIRGHHRCSFGI